jgi:ABC-type Na+ efflux pump permease subunit
MIGTSRYAISEARSMSPVVIGRIVGVAAGLLLQVLVVAPALGAGPLTIVAFVVMVVAGLVVGDRIAGWTVARRGASVPK